MDILKGILVVLHIIAFGIVFGGAIVQLTNVKNNVSKVTAGMLHGSWLLLVTGLALVGMTYALGGQPNNIKIGIKLIVLIAVIVLVLVGRKKAPDPVSGGLLGAIAGLSAVNVLLAVLWT